MGFAEVVIAHTEKIKAMRDHVQSEEATKNALIQPFLQLMGYDPFDPRIVVPEYTSDTGTKKKEKVDYAVLRDGEAIMLIECKCCGSELDSGKANQLHRYFQNTPSARVGILTDGVLYEFFSDLDRPNIMDEKPFMIFDFSNVDETLIPELEKLKSDRFSEDRTLSAAQNLKYTRQIKRLIANELESPSDSFVKIFASQIHSGAMRANIVDEFRGRVAQAAKDYVNEKIDERLKSAMTKPESIRGNESDNTAAMDAQEAEKKSKIVTTDEERDGFLIVKAIVREVVDLNRVNMRDTQSYCGILLDDNNRKPICRLHFNAVQKYLGVLDEERNETRIPIHSLDSIYNHANAIKATVLRYDSE